MNTHDPHSAPSGATIPHASAAAESIAASTTANDGSRLVSCAVITLSLARAMARHADAAACAERAQIAGDAAAVDRLSGPEGEAFAALVRTLPEAASAADVAAVVEHARREGSRDAAAELVLLRGLAAGLARRAFGGPAAAA